MGDSLKRLADAIAQSPQNSPVSAGLGSYMKCLPAVFQGTEAVDSNLSRITIGGNTFRFVPRLGGAWTSAPSAGTTILVGNIGGNLIVLGAQLGDTSKAS